MKVEKALQRSISILIGGVIAIVVLTRDPWRTGLLIGVFAIWGLWTIGLLLRPRFQMRRLRRTRTAAKLRCIDAGQSAQLEEALVRHVNYRISTCIRSKFPSATWDWRGSVPIRMMLYGGTDRIRLHGVPDYHDAEVSIDSRGNLRCQLLRVDDVPSLTDFDDVDMEDAGLQQEQELLDPRKWFDAQGRTVLDRIAADLNSRGHRELSMNEDGTITVIDENDGKGIPAFPSFPPKVYWPQLLNVLTQEGYAAGIDGDTITVTW